MPAGESVEYSSIPVEIKKSLLVDSIGHPKLDESRNEIYYCGFSIAGGIDQDYKASPQKYPDNGIYVSSIKPDGPAARSNLRPNDKILQVNGFDFTMVTHKKAVEYIKKGRTLNMLVLRESATSC